MSCQHGPAVPHYENQTVQACPYSTGCSGRAAAQNKGGTLGWRGEFAQEFDSSNCLCHRQNHPILTAAGAFQKNARFFENSNFPKVPDGMDPNGIT